MLTHLKKYWLPYTLLALAVIYVIISLVKREFDPMKWFSSDDMNARTMKFTGVISGRCYCNGTPQGGTCGISSSTCRQCCGISET